MSILPKFFYLFQTLPISIPAALFRQINTLFTKAHKLPRISRRLLTLPKIYGGIAVPDVRKYYQAAHPCRVIDWCRHKDLKLLTHIAQQFNPVPLHRAPWCFTSLPASLTLHPTIGPTLRVGHMTCMKPELSSIHSPLFLVLENPGFPLGAEQGPFRKSPGERLLSSIPFFNG